MTRSSRAEGFSLVEITLAIGIIAFAFVALIGMLPVGLNTYRAAIDTTNEMIIMQNFNSMIQVTDWARVKSLGYETSREIYYFDEEGRRTDTEKFPSANAAVKNSRLYAVKLFFQEYIPSGQTVATTHGYRVSAVFAPITNPIAMKQFADIDGAADLSSDAKMKKNTPLKIRSFLSVRMDSEKGD